MSPLRVSVLAGCVAATAACSDNPIVPTTIPNPPVTDQDLRALDSAYSSDALAVSEGASWLISTPLRSTPLAPLAAALRITLPPAPGAAVRRGAISPADARLVAGLARSASRGPVIPAALLGRTFEWDPDSVAYLVSRRIGAPANGVRFILYRPDSVTSYPDNRVAIGSLDIIDQAPAVGAGLRFLIRRAVQFPKFIVTPSILDYTLTLLPAASGFTLQAAGTVTNGVPGDGERRITFHASSVHADLANGSADSVAFTYDVNVPDVTVELRYAILLDTVRDTLTIGIDYRYRRGQEDVRFVAADTNPSDVIENGAAQVTVNGAKYAAVTIVSEGWTFTDSSGAIVPDDPNDQHYEDDVVNAMAVGATHASIALWSTLLIPSFILNFNFYSVVF